MNYVGVIIKESLGNKSVLTKVKVISTKTESVTLQHKTPWLKQWTLCTVEIQEEAGEKMAQEISISFDPLHPDWYVDYKNDRYHFIVYANKVFKVNLQNPVLYKAAKEYGISIGIPEYQVDFAPEEKMM
jgi:hypothetical protein